MLIGVFSAFGPSAADDAILVTPNFEVPGRVNLGHLGRSLDLSIGPPRPTMTITSEKRSYQRSRAEFFHAAVGVWAAVLFRRFVARLAGLHTARRPAKISTGTGMFSCVPFEVDQTWPTISFCCSMP